MDELEEEQDRYMDLRQEELLFRMKDELTSFLEKQRPITAKTKEYQASSNGGRLSRSKRRKVNGLGEEEQALAGKIELLVDALSEEGNLVYQSVLNANLEDLGEIARRLAGRAPDVGSFTTLYKTTSRDARAAPRGARTRAAAPRAAAARRARAATATRAGSAAEQVQPTA